MNWVRIATRKGGGGSNVLKPPVRDLLYCLNFCSCVNNLCL